MGKTLLTDDNVLRLNGAYVGLWGVGFAAAGDTLIKEFGMPRPNVPSNQFYSIALGALSARDLVLAQNKEALSKTKKNALKTNAAIHFANAGAGVLNTKDKVFRKEVGIAFVASELALGGLNLYQGLRKD